MEASDGSVAVNDDSTNGSAEFRPPDRPYDEKFFALFSAEVGVRKNSERGSKSFYNFQNARAFSDLMTKHPLQPRGKTRQEIS